jgi:dihydrolipoamide dehydrogenase
MRGVHAIGDVTGEPMLAHRAMAQGELVAEVIAGRKLRLGPRRHACGVLHRSRDGHGRSARRPRRRRAGQSTITALPLAAPTARAMTLGRDDGFVRIVHDRGTGLVLGIQAVGAGVSELAGQFALAVEMAATLTDIAATIHAHPTLGETVQEAALKGLGRALHL